MVTGDVRRKDRDQPQHFPAAVRFCATKHLKKCAFIWPPWKPGGGKEGFMQI